MLTASTEEDAVVEAVAAGATGYLQKETNRERLLAAVRGVYLGELLVPVDVVRRVFEGIRAAGRVDAAEAAGLTPRDREILISFARGMSYIRIGEERGIKAVTVRNAVYGIQQKLGVKSMQELVLWTVQNGLLDDDPRALSGTRCACRRRNRRRRQRGLHLYGAARRLPHGKGERPGGTEQEPTG